MSKFAYFFWLLKEIAIASCGVTGLIWSRDLKLHSVTGWVATKQATDVGRVIYANSITLTPGTITICVENKRLLVHSLSEAGLKDLKSGEMDGRIC